ncbi:MAG: hypothetical protein A3E37_00780 [Candidatus Andersenbacteria bacterium RIFCSPHIGHO2_12_FULL_46_9]|nr:MAG: hypothetical protein UW94_C0014G0010 [Parcubacteria group bacterium GW2011_GWA2_45_14]OGY33988.1 MAG: hypothetical protein A3B76_02270 [Candidatus Andersenbacteria bacterium RIFCSPHIGHO2_02_FULL_46_16]OGY35316.1 MAG: hypothetical protein A3E37_00780 [Candidatus Andersenbacteria bacterium RIFCSPHIGHO2_12_FULL_46_9]HBE90301.1 hypothetical protein [Candidatus Andersenbacteria bacterium]
MEPIVKKEFGLTAGLLLLSTSLFTLFTAKAISPTQPVVLLALIILFLLWVCLLAINLALVSRSFAWINLLAIVGIYILLTRGQVTAIIGATLFLLLSLTARQVILRELDSRIEYSTRSVFYSGIKYIIMGSAVLLMGVATPYITETLVTKDEVVPESLIRLLLRPYQPYLQDVISPELPASISVDIIANELDARPSVSGLSEEQRQLYTRQITQQLTQNKPSTENIVTIITEVINNKIRLYSRANPAITPIFIFLLAIIATRIAAAWLAQPPLLLIALLIWAARKINLFKLLSLSKSVEKLEL